MSWFFTAIFTPSAICAVHLWRRPDARWPRRLAWTFALLAPLIGPLLYGAWFRELKSNQYPTTHAETD